MENDKKNEKNDVRLVFDKTDCQECKTLGVIKSKNSKTYESCTSCNGNGHIISYKIKEIKWFKNI